VPLDTADLSGLDELLGWVRSARNLTCLEGMPVARIASYVTVHIVMFEVTHLVQRGRFKRDRPWWFRLGVRYIRAPTVCLRRLPYGGPETLVSAASDESDYPAHTPDAYGVAVGKS
jgi:hypothetical protein